MYEDTCAHCGIICSAPFKETKHANERQRWVTEKERMREGQRERLRKRKRKSEEHSECLSKRKRTNEIWQIPKTI